MLWENKIFTKSPCLPNEKLRLNTPIHNASHALKAGQHLRGYPKRCTAQMIQQMHVP